MTLGVLLTLVYYRMYKIRMLKQLRIEHEKQQHMYLDDAQHSQANDVVEEEMRTVIGVMSELQFKASNDNIMYLTNVCNGTDRFKSQPLEV